jgi:DNA polymerase V
MTSGSHHTRSRKGIGGRPKGPPTTVVRLPVSAANLARRLADGAFCAGDINCFLDIDPRTTRSIPLSEARVSCGFPSPADDYLDRALDFNKMLVRHPAATFAVIVTGESMTGVGIFPGDIAVVDRSYSVSSGCVILAMIDGEFTIKRYCVRGNQIILVAENQAYPEIAISPDCQFEVWGVITNTIRKLVS